MTQQGLLLRNAELEALMEDDPIVRDDVPLPPGEEEESQDLLAQATSVLGENFAPELRPEEYKLLADVVGPPSPPTSTSDVNSFASLQPVFPHINTAFPVVNDFAEKESDQTRLAYLTRTFMQRMMGLSFILAMKREIGKQRDSFLRGAAVKDFFVRLIRDVVMGVYGEVYEKARGQLMLTWGSPNLAEEAERGEREYDQRKSKMSLEEQQMEIELIQGLVMQAFPMPDQTPRTQSYYAQTIQIYARSGFFAPILDKVKLNELPLLRYGSTDQTSSATPPKKRRYNNEHESMQARMTAERMERLQNELEVIRNENKALRVENRNSKEFLINPLLKRCMRQSKGLSLVHKQLEKTNLPEMIAKSQELRHTERLVADNDRKKFGRHEATYPADLATKTSINLMEQTPDQLNKLGALTHIGFNLTHIPQVPRQSGTILEEDDEDSGYEGGDSGKDTQLDDSLDIQFEETQGKVFKLVRGYALDRTLSKSSNVNNKSVYLNYRLRRPYTFTGKDGREGHYSISFQRDDLLPLLNAVCHLAVESIDMASNDFKRLTKTTSWKIFMLLVAQHQAQPAIR